MGQVSWQEAWRALAAALPTRGLEALAAALEADDPRLVQGMTTVPPPAAGAEDWPVEAACAVGYCGWRDGLATVAEVQEHFGRAMFAADQTLNGPSECRHFLNWFDEAPRDEMRRLLLPEVLAEIDRRKEVAG